MTENLDPSTGSSNKRIGWIVAGAVAAVLVISVGYLIISNPQPDSDKADSNTTPTSAAPTSAAPSTPPAATSAPTPVPTESAATPDVQQLGGSVLPEAMSGQEAIDALGDEIEAVADKNGKTVEELEDLLLRDSTAHISPQGFIVYLDNKTP